MPVSFGKASNGHPGQKRSALCAGGIGVDGDKEDTVMTANSELG